MVARLRQLLNFLLQTFWLLPAIMVVGGILGALAVLWLDRNGLVPQGLVESELLYNGGSTGARTLLGAVASSTIGVAGTVFSITIAALSLAAGQMGPRLLRSFTSDRGNQATLGAFLGTFSYCLMVLRTVRSEDEGSFVPHLSLSVGILLAFVCVGTLVYFVGHMAGRINVSNVIDLVGKDLKKAIAYLTTEDDQPEPPPAGFWRDAVLLHDDREGYLQEFDGDGLAEWARERRAAVRMLVRPGDYVFPGRAIACIVPHVDGAAAAVRDATALGAQRSNGSDPEFAVGQLVEIAVRALSPGINDPRTAMAVVDRLGGMLCRLSGVRMRTGVWRREGKIAVVAPVVTYASLVDSMFGLIRQNAGGSAAVLERLMRTLTAVLSDEREPARVAVLQALADLILAEAERTIGTPEDAAIVGRLHDDCGTITRHGFAAFVRETSS